MTRYASLVTHSWNAFSYPQDIMESKERESLDKKLLRLRVENRAMKQGVASLKADNEELRKALRDRDSLFHSYPAGLVILQEGRVMDANQAVFNRLGYAAEEVIGRDFLDFVHPASRAQVKDFHKKRRSGNEGRKACEADLLTKAGEIYGCDMRIRKIKYNGRSALLGWLSGLEKKRRRESEQVLGTKMEALVTMASGLTRRYGPGLRAIAERVGHLKEAAGRGGKLLKQRLDEIEKTTEELINVTRLLERLAMDEQERSGSSLLFNLNEIVKKALSAAHASPTGETWKRTGKSSVKTYLRSISPVDGSPEEVKVMIEHLILNAMEGMPAGGNLYVSTEENAGSAHIYIQDSGVGIPHEIRSRVFDPFFSTKGESRMGMGLSLSHVVAKRHRGAIEVDSRKDRGTVIHVWMPLASKDRAPAKRMSPRGRVKGGRILIIEDDDMIRALLSQLLSSKGYKVCTADNAFQGLNEVKKKTFDMVIADAAPSDMRDHQPLREIRRIHRELPIAFITNGGEVLPLPSAEPLDIRITKPIDMNKVVSQVSKALTWSARRS